MANEQSTDTWANAPLQHITAIEKRMIHIKAIAELMARDEGEVGPAPDTMGAAEHVIREFVEEIGEHANALFEMAKGAA